MTSISTHSDVVNLYVSCILDTLSRDLNTDFTLGKCLFGATKLTKNANLDKYGYSCYGIRFDARSNFSLPDLSWGMCVPMGTPHRIDVNSTSILC